MSEQTERARQVVDKMYTNDPFSQWLGIDRLEVHPGKCILKMTIREEMTNGFGVAHGGIAFSLADSALAFASNSLGRHAMSIECAISHLKPVRAGDELTAETKEISRGNKVGVYAVKVTNQDNEIVAHFKGTVYRSSEEWDDE